MKKTIFILTIAAVISMVVSVSIYKILAPPQYDVFELAESAGDEIVIDGVPQTTRPDAPTLLASELNDSSDPHTLIVEELKNAILSNSESTGADEWDFPARTENWSFMFIIEAAQNVTLDPNGTEQWYLNGVQMAAGEAIVNSAPTVGEAIECISTESAVYCESNDPDWQEETP